MAERTEISFEVDPAETRVLDGYCSAKNIKRTQVMRKILKEWTLREFGKDYADMIGVWTGGSGDMPDGLPIFNELEYGCEEDWDGHVHKGFTAWLELRGWYTETYDAGTYFVIPIAYALEIGDEKSLKEVV